MLLYQNKYRIASARLPHWDYRNEGAYFITICTKNRNSYFGQCDNHKMILNRVGLIGDECWKEIPNHFGHVRLGAHIVMPNHVHGILIVETLQCNVSTATTTPTPDSSATIINNPDGKNQRMSDIAPKPGSVSTMIRSYKSACTKKINQQFPKIEFGWQARFHDHIIRNAAAFERISNYIINNPANWQQDKFHI